MIDKVATVSIFVRDQDKALDFYTNKLGFKLHTDAAFDEPNGSKGRWLSVMLPGDKTEIVLSKPVNMPQAEAFIGGFNYVTYNTTDIQKTYEELSAKGVEFAEKPTPYFWGIQAQFKDQDGNTFVLLQPPA